MRFSELCTALQLAVSPLDNAADNIVRGVCAVNVPNESPDLLSFLIKTTDSYWLENTSAKWVFVPENLPQGLQTPACLIPCKNPQLYFVRALSLLFPETQTAQIHPSAQIASNAHIGQSVQIEANVVIGEHAKIGDGVYLGAGCVIEANSQIGANSRLMPKVTVNKNTQIGKNALIQSGAVLGGRGFGFARDGVKWIAVPQIGRVILGDDVEIGANTTIDRGALGDTMLGDGVKIDNLVQIAHNVRIGAHTAIAAQVGIAGSTTIGARCIIAGQVGIADHLDITDDVVITGMSMVTRSIKKSGPYSSGWPAEPAMDWRKRLARLRRMSEK